MDGGQPSLRRATRRRLMAQQTAVMCTFTLGPWGVRIAGEHAIGSVQASGR